MGGSASTSVIVTWPLLTGQAVLVLEEYESAGLGVRVLRPTAGRSRRRRIDGTW